MNTSGGYLWGRGDKFPRVKRLWFGGPSCTFRNFNIHFHMFVSIFGNIRILLLYTNDCINAFCFGHSLSLA